ncbi:hypothetical protein BS47DRAFT_1389278 [Hydnum rufescens UP504]|uniref:Uncharacterized protein n=1 Tax=Hydnum rufescens UP504 TaxID=1448309 RepID=A0A9P6B5H5_9AGAM|nr:hypothetical protein BS47DRAFT_1389278 [Hydnum rufescens UP504]
MGFVIIAQIVAQLFSQASIARSTYFAPQISLTKGVDALLMHECMDVSVSGVKVSSHPLFFSDETAITLPPISSLKMQLSRRFLYWVGGVNLLARRLLSHPLQTGEQSQGISVHRDRTTLKGANLNSRVGPAVCMGTPEEADSGE